VFTDADSNTNSIEDLGGRLTTAAAVERHVVAKAS